MLAQYDQSTESLYRVGWVGSNSNRWHDGEGTCPHSTIKDINKYRWKYKFKNTQSNTFSWSVSQCTKVEIGSYYLKKRSLIKEEILKPKGKPVLKNNWAVFIDLTLKDIYTSGTKIPSVSN